MLILPFINPNSLESLIKPISQQVVTIKSNEYIEKEDFELYSPIKFEILSILVNQVDKYCDFNEDQWEHSGYKMPGVSTFSNVKGFLCTLPEKYLFYLSPDDIEPTPYGTFVLEFNYNDKVISLEIGKDKIGYYTKNINLIKPQSEGIDFDSNSLPQEILDAFDGMLS